MKKRTRILRLLPALLLVAACLAAFTSCNRDQGDGKMKKLHSLSGYTVIRADLSQSEVSKASSALCGLLGEKFTDIGITTDWEDKDDPDNTSPQILIGDTNRDASADARKYAEAQAGKKPWYYIGMSGDLIVITGSDSENIAAGVYYFISHYLSTSSEGNVKIPERLVRVYEVKPKVVSRPVGKDGTYVVSADLSDIPYYADPTGKIDMTQVIQRAINNVEALGGGVVYLPAGKYLISDQLSIPPYVTLLGDYVDPDGGDCGEGTVLILSAKGTFRSKSAVLLKHYATVEGLTFYYPGQSLEKPVAYHATIEADRAQDLWTIKDCTLVNSYTGITTGTANKGMTTLDNVKGTTLFHGYESDQASDICVATDVSFSPRYWANAGAEFGAPDEAAIRKFMKDKKSVGFSFGDCDRDTYENILLDGFYTGLYNREMTRSGLSGSYYNMRILDATIGIDAYGIDTRYGILLSGCTVSGSEYAIRNLTYTEEGQTNGKTPYVNLCHCTVTGKIEGLAHEISGGTPEDMVYERRDTTITYKNDTLFNLADYGIDPSGRTDISGALQKALDDAKQNGGGIVYIPAGVYLLAGNVTAGKNTVILGCQPNPQTLKGGNWKGTVLLVTYGKDGKIDSPAAITVDGDNSGVIGLNVLYPENGIVKVGDSYTSPSEYSYFLRCRGKNDFAAFLSLVAASRAIHFDDADNFIADRVVMAVFDNGFRVTDCDGGILTRIHTNGHYHCLGSAASSYLPAGWVADGNDVAIILDDYIVPRLTLITARNSFSIQIDNVFHYGADCYLNADQSDITIINGESARLVTPSFQLGDCVTLKAVNFMRPNNRTLYVESGDNLITFYNMNPANIGIPYNQIP